jgi:tRNA G10  N-methylase Trm11
MEPIQYLYNLNHPDYEEELCALEVKSIFNIRLLDKVFFENKKVNPSISPFLKNRLKIMFSCDTFNEMIQSVIDAEINATDFLVKYVRLYKNDPPFKMRRKYCKDLGYLINGDPLFTEPKTIFGITCYNDVWYFGQLIENDSKWKTHNDKPYTYSSSLNINTAKALVNIAGYEDRTKRLVDPCCGVGTVLLEAAIAGYDIKGWEINRKIAENARENLKHFDYEVEVTTGDINNIIENFDTSIIDLPYGNFSLMSHDELVLIIQNAKRISNRLVIVSAKDISNEIQNENIEIIESCEVGKNRNGGFIRYIWVCES